MKLFLSLMTIISSFSLLCPNKFFISAFILITCFIIMSLKYRHNRHYLIFLIFSCLVFTILGTIKFKTFQNNGVYYGIVIVKKNGYTVLFDGIEKLYFKTKDVNVDLFDLIKVEGTIENFEQYRKPIESGFDFKGFLATNGVFREIRASSYTILYNNFFNVVQYKNDLLSIINDEKCKIIVSTLMLGQSDFSDKLFLSLRNSGLLILITNSGLLINGLYYSIVNILQRKISLKKAHFIALIFVLPYLIINIDSISMIRVLLYRIIIIYYVINGKKYDSLTAKILPYIVLIIIDRYLINSLSIILPLTISSVLHFSNMLIDKKSKIVKRILFYSVLFFTMVPFTLIFTNTFNVVNILINIVFIPINKILLVAMYPFIFKIKVPFMENLLRIDYECLTNLNLKYFNVNGPSFNQYFIVFYYSFLLATIYFMEVRNKHFYRKIVGCFSVFLMTYFMPVNNFVIDRISFINVGQGDSTLISYKGLNVLVDTGGSLQEDLATNCLIPYLRKLKIYHLDYVYITHYDMDHYYALESLKKNFIIYNVYDYNRCPSLTYLGLSIYNINYNIENIVEENDKSLALYISMKNRTFLLMGDASTNVEHKILKKYPELDVDYLKCGHHGSDTSTSDTFVQQITPYEAIISCGEKNKYGHPNKRVIDTLVNNNVKIRRTDLEGTITYKFF